MKAPHFAGLALLCALTLALASVANAHNSQTTFALSKKPPRKVAIVGGGPSGTSAAYWLSQARKELDKGDESLEIHLYEKEERIGGRTKVIYPYEDAERYQAVELGASIFADVNRNMARFAKVLNLPTGAKLGEAGSITAIWDGAQFVLEDLGDSWWTSAKLFWRYGYSPVTTRSLVKDLVDSFLQLYQPKFLHEHGKDNVTHSGFPWTSIEALAKSLKFDDAAALDAHTWFYNKGVSQLFVEELIEAATRVNYGQNTDKIHALGAGVSLAASGATGVIGGNYRIFQGLLAKSDALVHLADRGEVTGIVRFRDIAHAVAEGMVSTNEADIYTLSNSTQPKWWVGTAAGSGGLYDAVFVGAPWHSAGITLMGTEAVIPTAKYVRLHVTLVATSALHPKAEYFGRTAGSDVPTTILTTYEAMRNTQGRLADDNKSHLTHTANWLPNMLSKFWFRQIRPTSTPVLDFNSLNYISKLPKRTATAADEHLVKIFSEQPITDDLLDRLFGLDSIGWKHRIEWDAYPELQPARDFADVEPDEGLFYINALETLVSTMETSTVASRNAVGLLLSKWFGPEFVHGKECNFADNVATVMEGHDDLREGWDGWGCRAG